MMLITVYIIILLILVVDSFKHGSFGRQMRSSYNIIQSDVINNSPIVEDKSTAAANSDAISDNLIIEPNTISNLPMISTVSSFSQAIRQPNGASYIMCSSCKTAYVMSENELGKRGLRVKCGVCEKEWFQSGERLLTTETQHNIMNMTDAKVLEVRKSVSSQNWPKYPKVDKVGVFVGNLPYTYSEKEIGELFGEYGVTGISLVKDNDQNSKGFAFIELASQDDAELMIKEMHHFFTDSQRKLTVRIAQPLSSREGGGGRGGDAGANGRSSGGSNNRDSKPFINGGGGGGGGGGKKDGGKMWTPR